MDFANFEKSTLGGILTGLVAIPYIAYKVWQTVKQDNKGDNVDARIQQFTSSLQTQLDKAIKRADDLQISYNALVADLAKATARAEVLANENQRLQQELQRLSAQTAKGIS